MLTAQSLEPTSIFGKSGRRFKPVERAGVFRALGALGYKAFDRREHPLDILRPRQPVVAVADKAEHNIICGKVLHQPQRMLIRHVFIAHALKNVDWTTRIDHAL